MRLARGGSGRSSIRFEEGAVTKHRPQHVDLAPSECQHPRLGMREKTGLELLEIPILRKDGEVRIVLWNSATIYAEDGTTPTATIAQGQDVTERKLAEDELARQATVDELTGIPNRREFYALATREMKRARRHSKPLSVAFIDIDHLKNVNDTLGHAAGDTAIQTFASASKEAIREVDLIARIGGDEFALLLPETDCE